MEELKFVQLKKENVEHFELAKYVMDFYNQSIGILHGKEISLDEWKSILSSDDEDEQNFLICHGCIPVAWFRLNGLKNKEVAWISMLVVSGKHQRNGIGTYAVRYAEKFAKNRNFIKMKIHTTEDNIPAQNLYKKCGYSIINYRERSTEDGTNHIDYTFVKEL